MAWVRSGVFGPWLLDKHDNSNLATDLGAEDSKTAFWGSSITPNFDSDTAYNSAPWNSGQSSGAGYTAGGPVLANTTIVAASAVLVADADNVQMDNTTIIAEGLAWYFPNVSNRIVAAVWFGAAEETQDGTFLVTWHSSGILRQTYYT